MNSCTFDNKNSKRHIIKKTKKRYIIKWENARNIMSCFILMVLLLSTVTAVRVQSVKDTLVNDQFQKSKVQEYYVEKGDTLWEIAKATGYSDSIDTREIVFKIEKLNGLGNSALQEGQILVIPIK